MTFWFVKINEPLNTEKSVMDQKFVPASTGPTI